ncbi:MAG: hypothetical protein Q8O89_07415 [Nanoarchaeota archaeon]|nr:hypothetical protein [Nanoarchaeota archaeon]
MNETITAYHGTIKIDKIIGARKLYCLFVLGQIRLSDYLNESLQKEDLDLILQKPFQKYDELTLQCADYVRELAKKGQLNDYAAKLKEANCDENLADLGESSGVLPFSLRIEYDHLKRNLFVYLSSSFHIGNHFAVSKRIGQEGKPQSAMMEFAIPYELIRPGNPATNSNILVKKELSLERMTKLYVPEEHKKHYENLLRSEGFDNVSVQLLE